MSNLQPRKQYLNAWRGAAALTVLEFNDTARKPKQGWREANSEGRGKAVDLDLITRVIWFTLTVKACIWFCVALHR